MLKNTIFYLFWLVISYFFSFNIAFAQRFDRGLPPTLTESPTQQYKKAVSALRESDPQKRKIKERFYLENIFLVNGLLKSGIVTEDSTFSRFCQGIMQQLNKTDVEANQKLSFYIVESAAVNAFATFDGSIFLCRGLLTRLSTEAQLAFVLSHEYIHVREQHAFGVYKQSEWVRKNAPSEKILLSNTTANKSVFEKCQFGQSLELEADIRGFSDYFAGSGYAIAGMSQTLDLLRYSYLPPQKNTPFSLNQLLYPIDTTEINRLFQAKNKIFTDTYTLPDTYYLDEPRAMIGENERENDSLSTHPNLYKRRITMHAMMDSLRVPTGTGRDFITFKQTDWLAWREKEQLNRLPQLYLEQYETTEAIYCTPYPTKNVLDALSTARALLMLTQFRNNSIESIPTETDDYRFTEGEMQRLAFALERLSAKELNVLTLHYLFLMREIHTLSTPKHDDTYLKNSEILNTMAAQALSEWVEYHSEDPDFFYTRATLIKKKQVKIANNPPATHSLGNEDDFPPTIDPDYMRYALLFLLDSAQNTEIPAKIKELALKKQKNHLETQEYNKKTTQKDPLIANKQAAPYKIVVINPVFSCSDARMKRKTLYERSETATATLDSLLRLNAKRTQTTLELLTLNDLKAQDTKRLADVTKLNKWLNKQLDYGTIASLDLDNTDETAFIEQFGTPYFLWTGVVSVRRPKDAATTTGYWLGSAVIWPMLPYALYYTLKPNYDTLLYAILYNMKTKQAKMVKYEFIKENASPTLLNLHIYDLFTQLQAQK